MACGSCGRSNSATRSASPQINSRTVYGGPVAKTRSLAPLSADYVSVVYRGPHGNHFIPSPTRKVRYYGYGGHGSKISVHPDDIAKRPDLFELVVEQQPAVVEINELAPQGTLVATKVEPDELTNVDGVGPARAEKLKAAGITTYAKLADAEQEELADILGVADSVAANVIASARELTA